MLTILSVTLALVSIVILLFQPGFGVLFAIAAKPTIDTSWESSIGGFSALQLVGAAVPLLVLTHVFLRSPRDFSRVPGGTTWLAYLFASFIGVVMMIAEGKGASAIDAFLRVLNGFAGFHMFHPFVRNQNDLRRLSLALIICGLVPMSMGLYQAVTGHVWRVQHTVGLLRNIGVYHDAVSLRYYGYMALTGVILYLSYFPGGKLRQLLFVGYATAITVVIYKVYSKAGVMIGGTWLVLWSLFRRQFLLLPLAGLVFVSALFLTEGQLANEIGTLFSKETAAIDGTGDEKLVLAGRAYVWEIKFAQWTEADLIHQLFGVGVSGGGAHNDFLRVLLASGLCGLITYVWLLSTVGIRVARAALRESTPFNVVALMIFAMWIIDTIGLTPGLYPGYQWFVWGMLGLALRGMDKDESTPHGGPRGVLRRSQKGRSLRSFNLAKYS